MNDWPILVIDGEQDSRRYIAETLREEGYQAVEAANGTGALQSVRETPPKLVILDLGLNDTDPERLIRTLKKKLPDGDIMVTTRQRQKPDLALRLGVEDAMEKPVNRDELLDKVHILQLRQKFLREFTFVGRSEKILQVMEMVLQVAPTDILVLITGESGTGKDLIAQAIHAHSARRNGPFLAVNCGAFAEGVLESELFGHERGAFTGAVGRRKGVFEQAHGGTIFLDEVGELPLPTQVKLLRVLEYQRFLRVGGTEEIQTDVRVIAATNRDLEEAIQEGVFRRDLYYRLNVIHIRVPPLRERRDDIPRLIAHFVEESRHAHNVPFAGISDEAMEWLTGYDWPGNIRELKNTIDRLVLTVQGRKARVEDLPESIYKAPAFDRSLPVAVNRNRDELERELIYKILWDLRTAVDALPERIVQALRGRRSVSLPDRIALPEEAPHSFPRSLTPVETVATEPEENEDPGTLEDLERDAIIKALNLYNGHREKAAKHLGIGVRTLYRRIEKYGLDAGKRDAEEGEAEK